MTSSAGLRHGLSWRLLHVLLAVAFLPLASTFAQAQGYPSKPVRLGVMPDLPTVSEAAIPAYAAGTWFGVLAPPGTPCEIVQRLHGEIIKLLGSAELRERLLAQGMEPRGNTPEQFAALIRSEIDKWRRVVKNANIKIE